MRKIGFLVLIGILGHLTKAIALQPDNVVLYMPFDQPPTKDTIQDLSLIHI